MSLQISAIITEADIRVPNSFATAQKVDWLNQVNQEFFDVVKIPLVQAFSAVSGTASYTLTGGVRAKNVAKVVASGLQYQSLQYEDVPPGRNNWVYTDSTNQLTLSPAPIVDGPGYVRFYMLGTTTFVTSTLTAVPDAPEEYHWIYILGLSERIAKAMEDMGKANNYATDYQSALSVAQQNYIKG